MGLFPGRAGTPMRIGGYLRPRVKEECAQDPAVLKSCFDKVGFTAYDGKMLSRCAELMGIVPSVDFQFDIFPDGSLGDTFGLSLSFNEVLPREAHACMESGYGARLMGLLEAWGLADERWRLLADAAFAQHIGYEREDGSIGRLALCVLFNFAKVKFVGGVAAPAKFYLTCAAEDLWPGCARERHCGGKGVAPPCPTGIHRA